MVYQLLSQLVLSLASKKPPSHSILQGSFHPIEGCIFNHFDLFFLISIVFYDSYNVIPHPPMNFQADTLSFDWILEVVTLRLLFVFHLGIS
jgi:hypothetical protein